MQTFDYSTPSSLADARAAAAAGAKPLLSLKPI